MAQLGQTLRRTWVPSGWPSRTLYVFRRWPVLSALTLTVLVLAALFAPLLAPHDPIEQDLLLRNAPPFWYADGSLSHPLGTDHVGRDVLSRIIHGARVSMVVAGISLSTGFLAGAALALVAGYFGGLVDELVMRLVDVWYSLPFLLLALVVAVVVGQSFGTVMGLLALSAWTAFVRIGRAEVLSLKTRDYVALARVAGASHPWIITRHILPGVINTLVVIATLRVGQLILMEATLSFLGAGIPPPTPAWGVMVAEGRRFLATAWWSSVFPGLAIFLLVMSLNFLGDWLRDHLDPRLRQA
jgi:peptide/nickel transport system permease protein